MLKLSELKQFIRYGFAMLPLVIAASCSQGMSEQQMLENAKTYLNDGEIRSAAIELRNILQKDSNNAEARFLLGGIGLEIGYLTSAEKEFRRAKLYGWNEEQAQLQLARVLIAKKSYQKLLDEIKIKNSWTPSIYANIMAIHALAEASLGRTPQAKTMLNKSRAHDENAIQVQITTIRFQLAEILHGDASSTLKKALSLYPDNSELLLLHATSDLYNKNNMRATETYEKIINRDSTNLISRDGRSARIGLARIQITDEHYAQADETLAPLLKNNHRDPVANYLSSLIAFSQGDYSKAELYMRKLLKLVPEHDQSQQLMGNIKFVQQDFDQAAHHLTTSLMKTPDNLAVYKLLSRTYIALNKSAEAKITIKKALSINPNDPEVLSLLSQLKLRQGDKKASINTLTQAIKVNPDNSALRKQLVIAYIATGNTEQAHIEIKNFQRLSNDIKESRKLSIRAYVHDGNINEAITIAAELKTKNPNDPEIISLNGNLHAATNNAIQARKHFEDALQLQDDFTPAIIGLARIERYAGNFDKAVTLYKNLLQSDQKNITSMLALSDLANQQNDTDEMLHWLEKARETSPIDVKSRAILANHYLQYALVDKANKYIQEAIKIAPDQTELLFLHSKILIAQKRYKQALSSLEKLLDNAPEFTDARVLLGKTFLHLQMTEAARKQLLFALNNEADNVLALSLLAETELQDQNFDKSLLYANKLQKVHPEHYVGYMQEGEVWLAKQDFSKAVLTFNKAWEKQQTAALAQKLYSASKHIENFETAIKPLSIWLNNNPNDEAARLFLAFTYLSTEHNEEAIQEYEKILENNPDDSSLLNNLAWLYSLEENPRALDFAERAFRLSPNNTGVLDTYGWVLIRQNQTEQGQRMLNLAMKKSPDNLEIQYHYATALIQSGDTDNGLQILKQLLEKDKSFAGRHDAKKLLEAHAPGE